MRHINKKSFQHSCKFQLKVVNPWRGVRLKFQRHHSNGRFSYDAHAGILYFENEDDYLIATLML
jgi:hypothetical protein